MFQDPRAKSLYDDEHSGNEERWISMGLDEGGKPLVVCHTVLAETRYLISMRLISARKATKKEALLYEAAS